MFDNLRKFITRLSPSERETFEDKTFYFLIPKHRRLTPSELKRTIENFRTGKTEYPTGAYFEAYCHAIDQMPGYRAFDVLQGIGKTQKTYKQLLLDTFPDGELPEELHTHFDDQKVIEEFSALFEHVISYIADSDKNEFINNLKTFREFLAMRK